MKSVMDYLLTPPQKALKEAVQNFVALELLPLRTKASPDQAVTKSVVPKLEEFLRQREGRPDRDENVSLSAVETVMVLEEILKSLPAAGPEPAEGRLFRCLSPELRSSAASLGSAQGLLASFYGRAFGRSGLEASGHDCEGLDQELADVLSAIEAARLMTFRAAILEDNKRPDAEESTEAKRQAEELASRAVLLAALIMKGEGHET
jgi:hypothetical protein